MDIDIDKEAAVAAWLLECKQTLSVIDKIGQSIILLNSKRSTLEERMIKSYLSELAIGLSGIIACLYEKLARSDNAFSEEPLLALKELTTEIDAHLDRLIKIFTYNPNYLEQYFEHDYLAQIKEREHLVERVKAIRQEMT